MRFSHPHHTGNILNVIEQLAAAYPGGYPFRVVRRIVADFFAAASVGRRMKRLRRESGDNAEE
jgi:hypothetical protein